MKQVLKYTYLHFYFRCNGFCKLTFSRIFLNGTSLASLHLLYFRHFYRVDSEYMNKFRRWLDSNRGPLVSEASSINWVTTTAQYDLNCNCVISSKTLNRMVVVGSSSQILYKQWHHGFQSKWILRKMWFRNVSNESPFITSFNATKRSSIFCDQCKDIFGQNRFKLDSQILFIDS